MDQTTLIILFVAIVAVLALIVLLRPKTKGLDHDTGLDDAIATGAADTFGEILGVDATPELPQAMGEPDALTRIKGLGPKAAAQLNALGISRYDQLAALTPDQLAFVDRQMGPLAGRLGKDRWAEQAGHLASGDTAGFEAKFGRLGE